MWDAMLRLNCVLKNYKSFYIQFTMYYGALECCWYIHEDTPLKCLSSKEESNTAPMTLGTGPLTI